MKKLINLSEIHDIKNESNLFQHNINPIFYEDIIKHSLKPLGEGDGWFLIEKVR